MASKKYSHLTKDERFIIETMLKNSSSLVTIAETLNRDVTTISKEIKKHRKVKLPSIDKNLCINRSKCRKALGCSDKMECYNDICPLLTKSPYVCNGCERRSNCRFKKYIYDYLDAHNSYNDTLSISRCGVRISKEEELEIEKVVYDLIKNKNQSVNEIYINNPDILTFTKQTFYNYVEQGLFHLKNQDLRRKVVYKSRSSGKKRTRLESKIRVGRTYSDFLTFIDLHPDYNVVEMDTVEGEKGGKCFLTFGFRKYNLLLIYLLESATTECVLKEFKSLKKTLGNKLFKELFRIILTDNGSEFFKPDEMEEINGKKEINLFYCDAGCSYQKGKLEKLHEYIRLVLPQGSTFDYIPFNEVNILMNNINNSSRLSLKESKTPYLALVNDLGEEVAKKLKLYYIKPNEVNLSKNLLKDNKINKKGLSKIFEDLDNYYTYTKTNFKLNKEIKRTLINMFINDLNFNVDPSCDFYIAKDVVDKYINSLSNQK